MKKLAAAAALAFALTGCGTHLAPGATNATMAALAAQAHKGTAKTPAKGTKAGKRPAPPAVKATKGPVRQGFAANQAAGACASALAMYQNQTVAWNNAYSDYDKDNVETEMLNILHQGLQNVESITSAQGVDATDRRSYDIADQALNRYDASYQNWQSTYDPTQKRYIVNQMMTDMVGTLQQIEANY